MTEVPAHLTSKMDALADKIAAGMAYSLEARQEDYLSRLPLTVRWAVRLAWPVIVSETEPEAQTAVDIIRREWGTWTINDIMDILGKNP